MRSSKEWRNAPCEIQSPLLYRGIDAVWTHKGQRTCQTVVSWHFTIGWKLTSTQGSLSAQLPHVLIRLAQELLFLQPWIRAYLKCAITALLAAHLPSAMEVMDIWWPRGQMSLSKSIKAPQSSPGAIHMGICCKPSFFNHLVQISESSTLVRTNSLLSKLKHFATGASVLWAVFFLTGQISSQYSCAVSFPRNEQPSCGRWTCHGNMSGKGHL